MKYLRLAFLAFATAASFVRAQDEQRAQPPTEIPDFSNLDEFIYEPKSTVTLGFRHLSGAKTSFSGKGLLSALENNGPATGGNINRSYHDGGVLADARITARLDGNGNPVTDPASGAQAFDLIAPDGKTNTWNYADARQLATDGFVAFHSYSASIVDAAIRERATSSTNGLELAVSRDMGKFFGTRATWTVTAGMSVNDLSAKTSDLVLANLTTVTDLYSLYGQVVPGAPYSAPSSSTTTVLDASGNAVLNEDGSTQTLTTDTTVLLGNSPASRTSTVTANSTSVVNRWKLKGAYYTFRAGPTVLVPIFSRLRASFSVGGAMVYAGTNYTVTQTYTPEIGADISDTSTSATSRLLPGYYADATLQFDLTDRAGFYAGAVFQSAGTYTQNLESTTAHYSTKIDLANQQGLRAGMSIRF